MHLGHRRKRHRIVAFLRRRLLIVQTVLQFLHRVHADHDRRQRRMYPGCRLRLRLSRKAFTAQADLTDAQASPGQFSVLHTPLPIHNLIKYSVLPKADSRSSLFAQKKSLERPFLYGIVHEKFNPPSG